MGITDNLIGNDSSILEEPVPTESQIAKVSAKSTGRQLVKDNVKQPTGASVHYATVSPHLLIEEAYFGNGGFLGIAEGYDYNGNKAKSYILPKPTENFYVNKVAGGVYNNIFKPFINELILPIFAAGVHYNTTSQPFMEFVDRANGNGSSYDSVKSAIGISAAMHQVSFAVMDKSPTSDKVKFSYRRVNDVYQDSEDQGFGVNDDGELDWIGFIVEIKEDGTLVRYKHIIGAIEVQEKAGNSVSGESWKTVEVRPTGIDVLNVYPMFYRDTSEGEYVPESPDMINIVYLLCNLYNLDTKIDYVIVQQAHGTLVISTSGEIVGIPDGQSSAVVLPMTSDGKPSTAAFLSIDAEILRGLNESGEIKLSKVKNLMGDKGVELNQTQSAESGIAKAFEFMGQNSALLHGVKMFERLDKWVVDVFKKLTSDTTGFDVEINYASDFYPATSMTVDELEVSWEMVKNTNLTLLQEEVMYNLATLLTKGRPHERVQEVVEQIELMQINDPLTDSPVLD